MSACWSTILPFHCSSAHIQKRHRIIFSNTQCHRTSLARVSAEDAALHAWRNRALTALAIQKAVPRGENSNVVSHAVELNRESMQWTNLVSSTAAFERHTVALQCRCTAERRREQQAVRSVCVESFFRRAPPRCVQHPSGITVRGCARGCMDRAVLLRASRQQQWSSVICEEAATLNSALERARRETKSAMHSGRTKGAHHTALERGEQKR